MKRLVGMTEKFPRSLIVKLAKDKESQKVLEKEPYDTTFQA